MEAEIPVSTTQCITGAIVGVSLCNGTLKAINWGMVGWIYSGWLFSLPLAGVISYSLMGFVVNAPDWRGL
jgi:solute carrier family 20 (sodium-dependent phosphate transporter)